ncbi:hypothetical protein BN179_3050019 [Clostridioides difficile T6]|nr:hypothetical protein BN179_3050019 [Clostridioides difficile T6]
MIHKLKIAPRYYDADSLSYV